MGLLDTLNLFNGSSNVAESAGYTPKVSIIMQSYLGNYPGARSNPIEKFHRAVESFLNQDYKNTELVIVSDGCKITEKEYRLKYEKVSNIKFVYVSSDKNKMYEFTEQGKFYRGAPRQAGIAISTGDIIAYMDSDDYITSNFAKVLQNEFYKNPKAKMVVNRTWFDHENILAKDPIYPKLPGMMEVPSDSKKQFPGIDANFIVSKIKPGFVPMAPSLIAHIRTNKVFWKDTRGVSEDIVFVKAFREIYDNQPGIDVIVYEQPIYVICHSNLNAKWDV